MTKRKNAVDAEAKRNRRLMLSVITMFMMALSVFWVFRF